jgi:hypothetical protein
MHTNFNLSQLNLVWSDDDYKEATLETSEESILYIEKMETGSIINHPVLGNIQVKEDQNTFFVSSDSENKVFVKCDNGETIEDMIEEETGEAAIYFAGNVVYID